jgi:hypothetical protein
VSNDRTKAVTAGFLGGLVLGVVFWDSQMRRSRRELYHKSPFKRLAALGYLGGQPGPDTVRILSDYVGWERHPALKRRGERLLTRMQSVL